MRRNLVLTVGVLGALLGVAMYSIIENSDSGIWHGLLSVPLTNSMFRRRQFEMTDIPNLSGKYFIVTGGYAGIGKETSRALAEHGAHVVIAGRNNSKCRQAVAEFEHNSKNKLKFECMLLDLESLKSVKLFSEQYISKGWPLHVLINNAGVMACPFSLTEDGIERQFAGNHMGHFFLTKLLLPLLEASTPSRIVVLSSLAHTFSPSFGFHPNLAKLNDPALYDPTLAYGQAKLANLLFSNELSLRVPHGVYVNAVHPGGVATELSRHLVLRVEHALGSTAAAIFDFIYSAFLYSPSDGALTTLYVATSADIEAQNIRGAYYQPIATVATPIPRGRNASLAIRLWQLSEDILASQGPGAAEKN